MIAAELPLHEKLTLLWHNHFATSAQKVRIAAYMAAQNQKLRTLALGDFRTLAYTMLTDAAMLRWLDGQLNTAKAPNENLAREFMELFTLGHNNGYTEDDVRAGARALTGWTISDGRAVLVARRRDPTPKTLFGATGDFDAAGFCDAVLARPGSASHVAGRLWQQLVSDEPPSPPALDRIVAAYGPERDLKALTRAILTDDEFTGGRATVVNTPVEWLVGVIRALRVPEQHGKLIDADPQGAGPAAVLPHRRQRLAARPGLAVHRVGTHPVARRGAAGPHRRPVGDRGRRRRRPRRRGRLSDRCGCLDRPHGRRAAPVDSQAGAAGRRRRQHAGIPDVMNPAADS